MSKNQISIAVIKDQKDICRLIFTKADNGRYDLKIDFLGNAFQVQSYRLFSLRPVVWNVSSTQNSMSYHYGKDNNPVLIHIKKENPTSGESKYTTLPISRIQAPNSNQMFPLPLLKMEIPEVVVANAKKYKKKAKHRVLDLRSSNVLELYMQPDGLFEQNFMEKYPRIWSVYITMSMEFFASNSILSDYQKIENTRSYQEPTLRSIGIKKLEGMELFASVFSSTHVNHNRKKLMVTFIENELTEPILLSGIILYKKDDSGILFGGANYRQVDFPAGLVHVGPIKNSVAEWTLALDPLSPKERVAIYHKAVNGRIRLRAEMKQFMREIDAEEKMLKDAVSTFMDCLCRLQESCRQEHDPHSGEDGYYVSDEDIWLMTDFLHHSEEIHLLFSKFMGNDYCMIIRRYIKSQNYTPLPPHEKEYDSNGCEIAVFGSCSIHEIIFNHTWLMYDDRFDVDLLRGNLNLFLDESEKVPTYSVTRASLTSTNDNWAGIKDKLLKHGFICGPVQYSLRDPKSLAEQMSANCGLLNRIYQRIILTMESHSKLH